MLLLTATTDKLQLVTDAANNVDVHASFVDLNAGTVTPGVQNTAITTAATTDIVAAPASSTQRNVKTLHVRNKENAPVSVTVVYDQNGTDFELHKALLNFEDSLEYVEGIGFRTLTGTPTGNVVAVTLPANVDTSSTTGIEVVGLSAPCGIGTWVFRYTILNYAIAAGNGSNYAVNHDGAVSRLIGLFRATGSTPTIDQLQTAAGMFATAARAAGTTAGWGTFQATDTAAVETMVILEGVVTVTTAGNLELWMAAEAGGQPITMRAGSTLQLMKAA